MDQQPLPPQNSLQNQPTPAVQPAPQQTVPGLPPIISPPGNNKKKFMLLALVAIVLLASVATIFLLSKSKDKPSEPASTGSSEKSETQKKTDDTERVTDINLLHSKLEEYYNENAFYPKTFTATTLSVADPKTLVDPGGKSIVIHEAVLTESQALAAGDPTEAKNYLYVPFDCAGTNKGECVGYVLKSFIKLPTTSYPNPYTRKGLNNF